MPLASGCNHVTFLTQDIDRSIAFYTRIFEAEVRLDLSEGPLRHALIDVGGGFCLHPFEFVGTPDDAAGSPEMFRRGHLDHFAIDIADRAVFDTVARRLLAEGATTGRVRSFGMVEILTFTDPDGMECEIGHWTAGSALSMADSTTRQVEAA